MWLVLQVPVFKTQWMLEKNEGVAALKNRIGRLVYLNNLEVRDCGYN